MYVFGKSLIWCCFSWICCCYNSLLLLIRDLVSAILMLSMPKSDDSASMFAGFRFIFLIDANKFRDNRKKLCNLTFYGFSAKRLELQLAYLFCFRQHINTQQTNAIIKQSANTNMPTTAATNITDCLTRT